MMLEGVISILEGMNPRMLEIKLAGFLDDCEPRSEGAGRMNRRVPREPRGPRPLAGFLRRLHYAAVRILRGALRLCAGRPEETGAGFAGDRFGLPIDGRVCRKSACARLGSSCSGRQAAAAATDRVVEENLATAARSKADLDRLRQRLALTLRSQVASHAISLEMGRGWPGDQFARSWILRFRFGDSKDGCAANTAADCRQSWARRPTICASKATPTMCPFTLRNSIRTGSFRRRVPRTSRACFLR